jgi:hypothetical protein
MPGSYLSSIHNPKPLLSKFLWQRGPQDALQGSPDEALAKRIFTCVEVLAPLWSHYNRPSVSGCRSLRASGIREMGWFHSHPCANVLPDTLSIELEKELIMLFIPDISR